MIGIIFVCLCWWSCLFICYSWMMVTTFFLVEGGLSSESGVEMLKWLEAFLLHSVLFFFFECKKHDRHLVS